MKPFNTDYHLKSTQKILDILYQLGVITHSEWHNAHIEKWGLLGKPEWVKLGTKK